MSVQNPQAKLREEWSKAEEGKNGVGDWGFV